jgi:hypothetical protein
MLKNWNVSGILEMVLENIRMSLSYKVSVPIFRILSVMYKICHHWQQYQNYEYLLIILQGVVKYALEVILAYMEICTL